MAKFYAVKKGRKKGVYNSWDECKKQVEGFKNAEYKSFSSIEDARLFLSDNKLNGSSDIKTFNHNDKTLKAYVDGSYSKENKIYSYGCVLIDDNKIEKLSDVGNELELIELWNVAGELTGAMKAIEWAVQNDYARIIIYHDYEGIAKWANKEWKAKKKGTKGYIDFIENFESKINIEFVKVAAHTGVQYNEEADQLAKQVIVRYVNTKNINHIVVENKISKEKQLFESIMLDFDNKKNGVYYYYKEFEFSENKLKKFAKSLWKTEGYKVSDISEIKVQVNMECFEITIEITNKAKNIIKFLYSFS